MTKEKKAILVTSFGTSHTDTLEKTIAAIEKDIAAAYRDWEVRRAFTSGMVLKVLAERDGIAIDNVAEAMNRLVSEGFREVLVQPTHVIPGDEYEKMKADAEMFSGRFDMLTICRPLLTRPEDYKKLIRAIMEQFPDLKESEALVLMGHGTEHPINAAYAALDYGFKEMGFRNVFVGTVEGYPDVETVLRLVGSFQAEKVILLPLMVVAGDHAVNDMAGDEEDSWKNIFKRAGYEVACVLKGLGEFQSVRDIYLEHVRDGMEKR